MARGLGMVAGEQHRLDAQRADAAHGGFGRGAHGVGQGDVALLDGLVQHELHGAVLTGGLRGPPGGQAGDGEDGALGGLHHRLVGGGHAVIQGHGEVAAVSLLLVLEGLGKAPEQEGENDAGVAAGAPQKGVELVDLLLLGIDGGRGVDHHLGQRRPVNGSSHVECSFL